MYYGLAGIVSLLLTIFFWSGHSGPYRIIADFQQSSWGVNLIQLSILACWAILYVPLHVLVRAIEKRAGVQRDPLAWKRLVALFNFLAEERPGKVVSLGILLLLMGGWFLTNSLTAGHLTKLSVADAEAGKRPDSRYVWLTDATIVRGAQLSFKRNSSVELYYPVIANTDATEPERITAFVRLDGNDARSPPREIVGELEVDGLPGALRAELADRNVLAANYFVVRHGRNPGEQAPFSFGMCGLGVAAIFVGVLWAKNRKKPSDSVSSRPPDQ